MKRLRKIWKWLLAVCSAWAAFWVASAMLLWYFPTTFIAGLLKVQPYDIRYFIPYASFGLLWSGIAFVGTFKIFEHARTSDWWGKLANNAS